MRDDVLQRFKAAQLVDCWDEERCHDTDAGTAINLIEHQVFDRGLGCARRMQELDRELVVILIHESQFQIGGHRPAVDLRQKRGPAPD